MDEVNQNFLDNKGNSQSISILEDDQSMLTSEISQSNNIFENILEELETKMNVNYPNDNDILEELDEPKMNINYPNEAYADLMTLVTKYNLSNTVGNAIIKFFNKHSNITASSPLPKSIEKGRKYMDNMNLPNFTFDKTCVLTYNNNEYYLHHRPLINCIKNILSISDIPQNFALTFKNLKVRIIIINIQYNMYLFTLIYINIIYLKYNGERAYSEQNTGIWWENTEKSLPSGSHLLSIMLYSDATNVDTLGKSQLHPIFMTIGNINNWRRNKPDAKQLLGYLPILKSNNNTEKKSEKFKIAIRSIFHNSLNILLNPLLNLKNKGIDLTLNDKSIWFFPQVSVIIADWPEAATFCLTYKSSLSHFPCHFCLVSRDNLANINLQANEIESRTHNNMQNYFDQNLTKSVSIENLSNFFWKLP